MIENATTTRDALLVDAGRITRDAEAQGLDPTVLAHALVTAWQDAHPDVQFVTTGDPPTPSQVSVEVDFVPDHATDVESLVFLVRDATGLRSAGIVLRFPSQYPDSFEPVASNGGGPRDHAQARARFFPTERPGPSASS